MADFTKGCMGLIRTDFAILMYLEEGRIQMGLMQQ